MVIDGRPTTDDLTPLRDRFRALLDVAGPGPVVCDVRGLAADGTAVDLLCRLALTARRAGRPFAILAPGRDLRDLLDLCGIAGALAVVEDQASRRGGSPNSGKYFGVSRKNVIPLMRPPETSTT